MVVQIAVIKLIVVVAGGISVKFEAVFGSQAHEAVDLHDPGIETTSNLAAGHDSDSAAVEANFVEDFSEADY